MVRSQPCESRMIGHTRKNLPQTVLRHAKSEALLENLCALFEDQDFESVTNAHDGGCCASNREGGFADN